MLPLSNFLIFFVVYRYLQAQAGSRGQWGTRGQGSLRGFQSVASCLVETFHFGGQPRPSPFQTPTPKPENIPSSFFAQGELDVSSLFLPTSPIGSYQVLTRFIPPV